MKVSTCILVFFAYLSLNGWTQVFEDTYFRARAEQGLAFTYNFQFEQAQQVFEGLLDRYEDHPAPYFLLATNRWWQSYITVDQSYHAYIEQQLDLALEHNLQFKNKEAANLEYVFFQYMCYAFKTRLHTLRREWLSAANDGRKALPFLRDGLAYAESSAEFYFSAGIYHYYAATYPEDHFYIRPFMVFFPDGDEKKGIAELEQAAFTPNFTQPEAMYYLGDIYLGRTGELDRGVELRKQLHEQYPGNTWFKVEYAKALVHVERYDEAENLLLEMIDAFEQLPEYRLRLISSLESPFSTQVMERVYHYQGVVLMKRYESYDRAIEHFELGLALGKFGEWDLSPLPPSNYYHIGLCYDRLGRREQAIQAYKQALDFSNVDHIQKQSQACLESPCAK